MATASPRAAAASKSKTVGACNRRLEGGRVVELRPGGTRRCRRRPVMEGERVTGNGAAPVMRAPFPSGCCVRTN